MMKAVIFNIQHFSVHDGPGVRSVVFFKGCNLKCRWCHNPESISPQPEILIYPEKCIGCGTCFQICPEHAHRISDSLHSIDASLCKKCFSCCSSCYAESLVRVGENTDTSAIWAELFKNKSYFQNGSGGVTFSGGECMLQPDALADLLIRCHDQGIHTAVDTAGNVSWSSFQKILPYTDLFLYDLKAWHSDVHKRCTGSGNERILDNFRRLAGAGHNILVRIPYIPGWNADELIHIVRFLEQFPDIRAELLPYHSLGNAKYRALHRSPEAAGIPVPDKETIENLRHKYGLL